MGKKKINKVDLVQRGGLFYNKFTDIPFTGETSEGSFKNGKEIIHGKGEYKDRLKEGSWVEYHDNGQLWRKGDYKKGKREGQWVTYWSNGQLYYQGDYKNDKREGQWVGYYSDGTVWQEFTGTFKNGEKINSD